MQRGRPLKPEIREKISSILAHVGQSYGYELYKYYQSVFGKITIRNLYYNLKKGLELGEFIILDIRQEIGTFTWGGATQHIYYGLGPYSHTYATTDRQKELIKKLPQKEVNINWDKEINKKIKEMEDSVKKFKQDEPRLRYEDKTKFKSIIKNKEKLLKEWMASKFDRQKAHNLHLKIEDVTKKLD